jgi:hypothetical protein
LFPADRIAHAIDDGLAGRGEHGHEHDRRAEDRGGDRDGEAGMAVGPAHSIASPERRAGNLQCALPRVRLIRKGHG